MAKQCKFDCGTEIEWNDNEKKFFEVGTETKHDYKRCGEILKSQGKEPNFPDNPNFQKNKFFSKKY